MDKLISPRSANELSAPSEAALFAFILGLIKVPVFARLGIARRPARMFCKVR
jgi:hypothetical protein